MPIFILDSWIDSESDFFKHKLNSLLFLGCSMKIGLLILK